jgi:hypothetical protein
MMSVKHDGKSGEYEGFGEKKEPVAIVPELTSALHFLVFGYRQFYKNAISGGDCQDNFEFVVANR